VPPIIRNVLAVIVGIVIGGIVNMTLVEVGGLVYPPPPGVDTSSMESLRESMHLLDSRHFVMPFLAHALGTLVGATVAAVLAASHRRAAALVVGGVFLVGGIAAAMMLPAPGWYIAVDLLLAYIPMAWLGWMLGTRLRPGHAPAPSAADHPVSEVGA
jgi:hypothetical protein